MARESEKVLPQEAHDRITFDFQNNQIIWETPLKNGTETQFRADEMRPLIYAILGHGEFDLSDLAEFLDVLEGDPELTARFYETMEEHESDEFENEENKDAITGLVRIEATIAKKTSQALETMMNETGMTIGEIIDRLTLRFSPDNLAMARSIAIEEIGLCLSNLPLKDKKKGLINICSTIMSGMTAEEQESILCEADSIRQELIERLKKMDRETLKQVASKLQTFFRNKGNN